MTIDNYAPCPCGSGKKMKFCKCVEHPQDYEKIVRLIEGGQELAALDRVNQLLAKTPNAAWLLAIKGELALSLNEHETFKDTALRFLKLKPDNPLALVMRSLVGLVDNEPLGNVARMLLDGLAESRHGLPQLVLGAIELLSERLRYSPLASFRFFWSRLLVELSQAAEQQRPPEESLPTDNLLSMCPPPLIPAPAGAAWIERANEVASLKSSFRYGQAETKLRSILRDYPDQPAPLSQLLQVQLVLLDQEGATATARKLGTLRELSEVQRDYFAAMALDIEKDQAGLRPKARAKYYEISSEESAREALAKLGYLHAMADEPGAELRQDIASSLNDEVPAKTLYSIMLTKTPSWGAPFETGVGTLALLGRQTDKPPRAFVMMFDVRGTEAVFDEIVAALGTVSELEDPSAPRDFPYTQALDLRRARVREVDGDPVHLQHSEVGQAIADDFLNLPFPALGDSTPLEAVEEEPKRATVRAVLTHLEGAHHLAIDLETIDAIYERLQLTRPTAGLEDQQGQLNISTFLELARTDVSKLADVQLMQLLATSLTMNIENVSYRASKELLKRPRTPEMEALRGAALNTMTFYADKPEDVLELLEQLEETIVAHQKSPGQVIMRRFSLLNSLGRHEEASESLRMAFQKYPDDPYLISLMRYIMQQAQRSGAGEPTINDMELLSRMQRRNEVEPEPESSLVLPGQSGAGDAGKSKLWLPGS